MDDLRVTSRHFLILSYFFSPRVNEFNIWRRKKERIFLFQRKRKRTCAIDGSPSLRESGPPITPASLGPGWPESAPSWRQRLEQQVTADYTLTFRFGDKARRKICDKNSKDLRESTRAYENIDVSRSFSRLIWNRRDIEMRKGTKTQRTKNWKGKIKQELSVRKTEREKEISQASFRYVR